LVKATEKFQAAVSESQWASLSADTHFTVEGLPELLKEYQDPAKADKITAIKKDLDDTSQIVMKSIDQLLERGEKLEDLVDRSEDLSFQSKAFAKKAEDLNSCCTLF